MLFFFHFWSVKSVLAPHFVSCPAIGCCVILGEVNSSCCCVEGRETQWKVLIGAPWSGERRGLLAHQVLMISLPYNPLYPGSARCEGDLNLSTPLYYGIPLTDSLSPQCKWTCKHMRVWEDVHALCASKLTYMHRSVHYLACVPIHVRMHIQIYKTSGLARMCGNISVCVCVLVGPWVSWPSATVGHSWVWE